MESSHDEQVSFSDESEKSDVALDHHQNQEQGGETQKSQEGQDSDDKLVVSEMDATREDMKNEARVIDGSAATESSAPTASSSSSGKGSAGAPVITSDQATTSMPLMTALQRIQQQKRLARGQQVPFETRAAVHKKGTTVVEAMVPTARLPDSNQHQTTTRNDESAEEKYEETNFSSTSEAAEQQGTHQENSNDDSWPVGGHSDPTAAMDSASSDSVNRSQQQQQPGAHYYGVSRTHRPPAVIASERSETNGVLFTAELVDEDALRQEAMARAAEDWEREVMSRTVTAEDIIIVDEAKRRRRRIITVVVAAVSLLGILVGTLVTQLPRNNDDSNNTATLAPDAFAITNNTKCVNAMPLSTKQGSNTRRSNLQNTTADMEFHSYSCPDKIFRGTGRWYNFNSSGYNNSTIYAEFCVTEGSPTALELYTGNCDHLDCITGDDDDGSYQYSLEDSHFNSSTIYCQRVSFQVTEGLEYKFLVTGSKEEDPYSISVSAENDVCRNAYPLDYHYVGAGSTLGASADVDVPRCDGSHGQNDTRKTPGVWYHVVGIGFGVTINTCGSSFPVRVSVFRSDFGPYCKELHCDDTAIYNNDACGDQGGGGGTVSWYAQEYVRYYVLFHGDETYASQNSSSLRDISGTFIYTTYFDSNASWTCEGAIWIPVESLFVMHDATVEGQHPGPNSAAWSEAMASRLLCNGTGDPVSVETAGTWYRFKGFNGPIALSTCNNRTNYDTKISVYRGSSCRDLVCIAANDNGTAPECLEAGGSYVELSAESGGDYFVYVHGSKAAANASDFVLHFKVQSCRDLQGPFVADGRRLPSTTVGASPRNLSACSGGPESAPSAVFLFYGTGTNMTASTCHNRTNFETRLAIMTKTCIDSQWKCHPSDSKSTSSCGNGQSMVTWMSDPGVIYYVVVYGSMGNNSFPATGNFALSVTASGIGDSCTNAVGPFEYPFNLYASAAGGSVIDLSMYNVNVSTCGTRNPDRKGIWYTLYGMGEDLSLQVCPMRQSDNITATVFNGDCNALDCVTSSVTDICNPENALVLPGNENQTYHVLVRDQSLHSESSFEFTVVPLSGGSTCEEAQVIPENYFSEGRLFMGSTVDASFPNGTVLECAYMNIGWPGVWFKIEGLSGAFNLDTCWKPNSAKYNWNMSLDTVLAVFSGTCDQLTCESEDTVTWCNGVSAYRSNVTLSASASKVYYVFVSGYQGEMGNFVLNTQTLSRFANNNGYWCETPIEVSTDNVAAGTGTIGRITQFNARSTENSCADWCGLGLWYRITGIDGTITATTLNDTKSLALPVNNGVFALTGTCNNQTCISSSFNQASDGLSQGGLISFKVISTETYYIVVCSDFLQDSYYGDFMLTIKWTA